MELQVQELLEKIKSEGMDVARAEAEKIVAHAEGKAKAIVGEAEKHAAELEAQAGSRIEAMEKAGLVSPMNGAGGREVIGPHRSE